MNITFPAEGVAGVTEVLPVPQTPMSASAQGRRRSLSSTTGSRVTTKATGRDASREGRHVPCPVCEAQRHTALRAAYLGTQGTIPVTDQGLWTQRHLTPP